MARKCVALSCSTTSEGNIFQLFKLPKDQLLKKIWSNEIVQGTKSNESYYTMEEKYLCELHFEEHQWEKNSNRKCLKLSAIPTVFLQTRPEDYVKNVCFVLFSTHRDEGPLLKLVYVSKQLKSCIERENEERKEVWKKLGMLLVESKLQKARINKKKELLLITVKNNKELKTLLRQKVQICENVILLASSNM